MDGKRAAGLSRLGAAALIGTLASGQVLGGWYFINRVNRAPQTGVSPVSAVTVSSPEIEALRRQLEDINGEVAQITSEREALRQSRDQLAQSKQSSLAALEERIGEARAEAERTRATLTARLTEEEAARQRLAEDLKAARAAREALDRALKESEQRARAAEEARQRYEVLVKRLESSGLNVKRRAGLTAPPDLKAVVVKVLDATQPTRLVIDVGARHGIERDDVFQLTRDGKSLGKARVISAEATVCLARVMELAAAESVLAGDTARTVRGPVSDQ